MQVGEDHQEGQVAYFTKDKTDPTFLKCIEERDYRFSEILDP